MPEKIPLHERLREVIPTDKWVTLDDICSLVGSKAKSYVKVTLFAMPDILWQRTSHTPSYHMQLKNRWYWEFKKVNNG